jgi:peptidoglycan/LPS O-acetylase OafA/YrhL
VLYAIPLTPYSWISTVYWSLAYEFVFYIVTGLTFAWLIARPVELTVLLAAVITAALPSSEFVFDFHIAEFLAGIIVMRIVTANGEPIRLWFWLAVCLAALVYAAGPWVGAAVALAAAAILLLRDLQLGRWAFFIGSISYSLYLTHTSIGIRIVMFGRNMGSGFLYEFALLAMALIVSVAFAWVFSRLVERPAMLASRRIAA